MHANLSSLASIFVSLKFPDLNEYFLLFQKKNLLVKSVFFKGFLCTFAVLSLSLLLQIYLILIFIELMNIHELMFFKLLLPKYSPSHYVYCAKIGKLHLAGLTILIEVPKYALFYYWTSLHTKRPDLNVFSPTGKKLFFLKY